MKIWTAALAGSLAALGAAGAHQAHAQAAPFLDTPTNHWAYEAVQNLAAKKIIIGYPDGTYGGRRPMTRYEFAVAIDRLLRTLADMNSASPPPGTPAPQTLTNDELNQVQALIDKFRPELDTIQSNLKQAQDDIDALRADVLDAKALANKAQATADNSYGAGSNRKFQISGYVQARYQAASAGQGALNRFPQGVAGGAGSYNGNYLSGSNGNTFDVRRARLKFTGGVSNNTKYGVQIDASGAVTAGTNPNQQVTVREGYVAYTTGNGDAAKNLTATAGLFANPFGYILPVSSATYLSPERPLAFSESGAGIWTNQDYDKGIQLSYGTGQQLGFIPAGVKLTAALINGSGRTSDATDNFKNQIYRIAYQTPNKVVSVGGSYYFGQISTSGIPGNLIGGTTANPITGTGSQYTGRKKELYGADAQIVTPFGPFLNAEYVGGLYEQRSFFAAPGASGLSTAYAKGNRIDGYYVNGGWTFGQTGSHPLTLAVQYDVLRRGEGKRNGIYNTTGGNGSYTDENVGYGALYNLDKATRLRFWFERPDRVAHAPGTATPPRYGLFTGEVQVKF